MRPTLYLYRSTKIAFRYNFVFVGFKPTSVKSFKIFYKYIFLLLKINRSFIKLKKMYILYY